MTNSNDSPPDEIELPELPNSLKLLRGMVFALLAVMIVGFIVLIVIFVTQLRVSTPPPYPDQIQLPAGEAAAAVTVTRGAVLIITETDRILVFDRSSGAFQAELVLPTEIEN